MSAPRLKLCAPPAPASDAAALSRRAPCQPCSHHGPAARDRAAISCRAAPSISLSQKPPPAGPIRQLIGVGLRHLNGQLDLALRAQPHRSPPELLSACWHSPLPSGTTVPPASRSPDP